MSLTQKCVSKDLQPRPKGKLFSGFLYEILMTALKSILRHSIPDPLMAVS